VRPFLDRIGVRPDAWGARRSAPGQDGRDHGPAIEVYLAGRYFAVTEDVWPGTPNTLATLNAATLDHLSRLIPPAKSADFKGRKGADNSRSAIAFGIGLAMRRQGKTFKQMCEALRTDPETAEWVREKGDANGGRELRRIWDHAFEKDGDNDACNLPTITVRAGLRHEAADAGLAALHDARVPFYQRDQSIVRICMVAAKTAAGEVTLTPGIATVTQAFLGRALGRVIRWEKFDRHGKAVRIDPPGPVVQQISEMSGEWPFPVLAGVIGTPTMRPDGTLLLAEGYDESTGLVLLGAPPIPSIPQEPTRQDAESALRVIDALLDEFPFRDGGKIESVDRAVALSELMTPVLRGAMVTVPMHLVNAPQPGTGKSYLADLASGIATGERCAVVAFSPDSKETEKRLNGSALAGHPIIGLDNASGTIEGDLLCQMTERPLLQLRPLGTSKMVRVPNTYTVLANGNNAVVAADMVRRTIECRLDANMESPESRVFHDNPLARITRDRGVYIAACLTIARAYICTGKPGRLAPLASYEAWSDLVRSPLVWLGRADPVASMSSLRSLDPARQSRVATFKAWAEELGTGGAYLTSELISRANDQKPFGVFLWPGIRAALLDVARDRRGEIDATRLGRWLGKTENNIAAGFKLISDRGDASRPRWLIIDA
jgi:putative DNA primase/helicase